MSGADIFNTDAWITALGVMILHSLWQFTLIAALTALILRMYRPQAAHVRYRIMITAVGIMALLAVFTAWSAVNIDRNSLYISLYTYPGHSSADASLIQTVTRMAHPVMPYIVFVWILGAGCRAVGFAGGFWILRTVVRNGAMPAVAGGQQILNRLKRRIGVAQPVQLLASPRVTGPMVMGIFKPVIIVPAAFMSQLPPDQVEAVLLHELAHILRKDYLLNIIQSIMDILFFYHPAVWWVSSAIRRERELCCDDLVINVSGDSVNYAKALLALGTRESFTPAPAMPATGRNHQLLTRVQRILEDSTMKTTMTGNWTAVCLLLIGATCFMGYTVNATDDPVPEEEAKIIMIEKVVDIVMDENGDETGEHQKVKIKMENGDITELVVNGEVIPPEEYDDYEDLLDDITVQLPENCASGTDGDAEKKCIVMIKKDAGDGLPELPELPEGAQVICKKVELEEGMELTEELAQQLIEDAMAEAEAAAGDE